MNTNDQPIVGEVIEYQSFGTRRIVRVTDVYEDVKNGDGEPSGEPGFDATLLREDGRVIPADDPFASVWGYTRQITRRNVSVA